MESALRERPPPRQLACFYSAAVAWNSTAVDNFERKLDVPDDWTIARLQAELEDLGAVFIEENGGGIGVRLKFTESEAKRIARLEDEGGIVANDRVP